MTRRRWIADAVSGNRAFLFGEHASHLTRVLRARVGQSFDISAHGLLRRGAIVSLAADRVEFELGEEILQPPNAPVTLALSIFKYDRMEWAIEKCTELGVAKIIPVMARRTDAHLVASAPKRLERWQRIAREASEQSRRLAPPEFAAPLAVKDAVALKAPSRILLSEVESQVALADFVRRQSVGRDVSGWEVIGPNVIADEIVGCEIVGRDVSGPEIIGDKVLGHGVTGRDVSGQDIILAVGPEGGWAPEELGLFAESGWTSVSLGPTILRAETAAIAATAIVMASLA